MFRTISLHAVLCTVLYAPAVAASDVFHFLGALLLEPVARFCDVPSLVTLVFALPTLLIAVAIAWALSQVLTVLILAALDKINFFRS